jgi:hypothetical protein
VATENEESQAISPPPRERWRAVREQVAAATKYAKLDTPARAAGGRRNDKEYEKPQVWWRQQCHLLNSDVTQMSPNAQILKTVSPIYPAAANGLRRLLCLQNVFASRMGAGSWHGGLVGPLHAVGQLFLRVSYWRGGSGAWSGVRELACPLCSFIAIRLRHRWWCR